MTERPGELAQGRNYVFRGPQMTGGDGEGYANTEDTNEKKELDPNYCFCVFEVEAKEKHWSAWS